MISFLLIRTAGMFFLTHLHFEINNIYLFFVFRYCYKLYLKQLYIHVSYFIYNSRMCAPCALRCTYDKDKYRQKYLGSRYIEIADGFLCKY